MARPRQIDETALLESALQLFWSKGYAGTSIEDIARATGIGNGSIYAAYHSKDGLYVSVVTRYCEGLKRTISEAMTGSTGDVSASLREYLELVICDCISQPGRRGCLMLNSIELAERIPGLHGVIDGTNRELQEILVARLLRDVEQSDTSEGGHEMDLESLSAHYVTLSQGLIQRSRLGHTAEQLRTIAFVTL